MLSKITESFIGVNVVVSNSKETIQCDDIENVNTSVKVLCVKILNEFHHH